MGPDIGKWIAGICVSLLVVVLLVKAANSGNHSQATAGGAQSTATRPVSSTPVQTTRTTTPKQATRTSGKRRAKSTPVPRNVQGKPAPKEPKVPLLQRVVSFLDAYYYVAPDDTEESHRVYIASEAPFVSSSWLNQATFGIDTNNATNRKRWSQQLTLTGKFKTGAIHITPATDGSGNVVVTVPVRVSAQDATGRTVYAQTRQTTSVWRNRSGNWTLVSFTG